MAAGSYTDPLQNRARTTTNEAKDQANAIWNDTKDSARSVLNEQQRAAAGGLGEFANALRKVAREMGDRGQAAPMSRMMESAAQGLERFSGSLREKDMSGLVRDVESFARRQPVAFFGAAVAAGFLAVRFLKSSNQGQGDSAPASTNRDSTLPY
jgi:hypothetical protein